MGEGERKEKEFYRALSATWDEILYSVITSHIAFNQTGSSSDRRLFVAARNASLRSRVSSRA